jgi:hypothetical protein
MRQTPTQLSFKVNLYEVTLTFAGEQTIYQDLIEHTYDAGEQRYRAQWDTNGRPCTGTPPVRRMQ